MTTYNNTQSLDPAFEQAQRTTQEMEAIGFFDINPYEETPQETNEQPKEKSRNTPTPSKKHTKSSKKYCNIPFIEPDFEDLKTMVYAVTSITKNNNRSKVIYELAKAGFKAQSKEVKNRYKILCDLRNSDTD